MRSWISPITTVRAAGAPASAARNQADLPVPRGPSGKKLCSGTWKNRVISAILRRKVETTIPKCELCTSGRVKMDGTAGNITAGPAT